MKLGEGWVWIWCIFIFWLTLGYANGWLYSLVIWNNCCRVLEMGWEHRDHKMFQKFTNLAFSVAFHWLFSTQLCDPNAVQQLFVSTHFSPEFFLQTLWSKFFVTTLQTQSRNFRVPIKSTRPITWIKIDWRRNEMKIRRLSWWKAIWFLQMLIPPEHILNKYSKISDNYHQ